MMIYEFGGHTPVAPDGDAWVAPTAVLLGNVCLARNASVWFGAVLRGDNGPIYIGEGSNVQDVCVLHSAPGCPINVGRSCSIGHSAVLHGCNIGDYSLIGIGAIILDGAHIGRNCVIGAGAFVPRGKRIPDNSVVLGAPGRIVRQLDESDAKDQKRRAFAYEIKWRRFMDEAVEISDTAETVDIVEAEDARFNSTRHPVANIQNFGCLS
jgi:carbonic anhydrase/acetyltransferase-like protein (isoleucine patch superfamily)